VRINGENPAKDFQPCPGILGEVKFPTELDGVRVDSWVEAGTEISPFYDSLLAKLMVFAPTRELAVKKMKEAIAGGDRGLGVCYALTASQKQQGAGACSSRMAAKRQ
jgi:acetyl/propionyl-CoA carboxylase alpha subunit